MNRSTVRIEEAGIDYLIDDLNNQQPAESALGLEANNSYVVLPGGEAATGFRTLGRAACTGVSMIDSEIEVGGHYLPVSEDAAELVIHRVFGGRPGRKFGLIVASADESWRGIAQLIETMTHDSGGRRPDLVVMTNKADFEGDVDPSFGQLVHEVVRTPNGCIHTYKVPGTSYFRSGTLEELSVSDPARLIL